MTPQKINVIPLIEKLKTRTKRQLAKQRTNKAPIFHFQMRVDWPTLAYQFFDSYMQGCQLR